MVGEQIDNSTISADASLKATLSLAAVCVDCMVHPAALMQEKCRDCGTWTKRRSDRTHRCNDCARSHRQQLQQKAAAAAAAAAPSSSPAPPPPRFDHDPHSHSHLSQEQRITIRILRKEGLEVSAIAARIPCHVDTVRHWLAQEDTHDSPRSGRPRSTDEAMDTTLAFVSHVEPFATPRQLKRKLGLDVSVDTIDRRLIQAGLHGRIARHVFQLTDAHKRQRLSFSHGYSRWTADDWCRMLFADVKTFRGKGRSGQVWVRRPVGEASNPEYSVAHKPHPVSVPAWGCFSAAGPGYMAMFEGSLDAAGLRDIFRDYLLPTVKEQFGEGADWWLLHDNDPGRHKSQVLRTFMHNNYIRPLDFPPYSPDLNPIENLWADMDKRMDSSDADTKEELEKLVADTWAVL